MPPSKIPSAGQLRPVGQLQDIPYGMTPEHRWRMDAREARLALQLFPGNNSVDFGGSVGATEVAELKWIFLRMGPNVCLCP